MTEPISTADRMNLPQLLQELRNDFRAIRIRYRVPESESDDLLQETAVALLAKKKRVREPRTWLLATYRNRCRLYWRSRRRAIVQCVDDALLETLGGSDPPRQETRALRRSLGRFVKKLPSRCRPILEMRYGLECTHEEIARRLGIEKSATVRQAAVRCLTALATALLAL